MSTAAKTGAKAPRADQRVVRAAMTALRETVALTRAEQAHFRRQLARRLGEAS